MKPHTSPGRTGPLPVAIALIALGSAWSASAQTGYTIHSSPPGIVATQTGSGMPGDLVISPQPPMESGAWRFSRWTANGSPVLSPAGPARTQARLTLGTDALTLTAIYLPQDQDSDGDTIPDWIEWRELGTLAHNTASNPDGDAADTGVERRRGWAPALPDTTLQGGVSRTSSTLHRFRRPPAIFGYRIRSEPPGLLAPQVGEVAAGAEITTPNPVAEVQNHWFTHWTVNGVRQNDPTGAARTRLTVPITADDTELVAHFTHRDLDSDADGIPDWIELRHFGSLAATATGDPDADGTPIADELRRGHHPAIADTLQEGGLARTGSATFAYHNPAAWVYYTISSLPVGLIAQSGLVPTGTVITTGNEEGERQGYRLAYWSVDGVRQTSASGYSPTRLQVALDRDYMQIVAHFVPKDVDSDADGIPDWLELRHFGHLDHDGSADTDTDAFDLATEQRRGFSPVIPDAMQEGGLARTASATIRFLDPDLYKLYTLRSEPSGFLNQTEVLAPGTPVTTPNEFGARQSYHFSFWSLNGVRQAGPNGTARTRLQLTADVNLDVIGHYTPTAADTDSDTLPDWWELFHLGTLAHDAAADSDGDTFPAAAEHRRGTSPAIPDLAIEGGLARTASRTLPFHRPATRAPYVIRSEPPGLIPVQQGSVPHGEIITTPLLNGTTQNHTFAYWSVNGVRQASPSGRARNQVSAAVITATEFIAHYFHHAQDSDGDGIPDHIEWAGHGTLAHGAADSPDGDSFTLAEEVARGYSTAIADGMLEGGLARTPSRTVLMQLAAYNIYHPLAVTIDPPGGGSVHGGGSHKQGITARLEATVPPGVNGMFSHWSGDLTGSDNPAFLLMDGPKAVTAHFTVAAYRLLYTAGPNGSVTGALDQTVPPGQNGTAVTAVPAHGHHFVQWSDGVTANPRTDTAVNAPVNVAALFAINLYPVVFDLGPLGTHTGGGALAQMVEHGAAAQAPQFTVAPHWLFTGWSTAFDQVTSALTVTAQYQRITHAITAEVSPPQAGSITGTGVHDEGTTATVALLRHQGWKFLGWSENGIPVGSDLDHAFNVLGPRHLVAHLEPLTRSIDPAAVTKDLIAQSYTIAVTSNAAWSVTSRPVWAQVSPVTGQGNGVVTVTLDANLTALARSGVIRFDGFELPDLDHALTQLGGQIKLSHRHAAFLARGGSGKVGVTTSHYGLAWTAVSHDPWLQITSGDAGAGNGEVVFQVAALSGSNERTGTLTIGGKTFTIVQSSVTAKGELRVSIDGAGTVSGAPLDTPVARNIGRAVTLTAKPQRGHRFKSWTGDGFEFPPGALARPGISFIMGEKVNLTAHFEPDPFALLNLAGSLRGVSEAADPIDATIHGALTLTLGKTGAYTCVFKTADGSYTGRGALTSQGLAEVWVKRRGREPVHLRVMLAQAPATGAMVTARLASEIGPVLWTTAVERVALIPRGQRHPAAGRFTAVLVPEAAQADDFGVGHAAIQVSSNGSVRVSGALPDGLAYTTSSVFLVNDTWPLFRAPYGKRGYLLGSVVWDGSAPSGALAAAPVKWVKLPVLPKSKDPFYRDGFNVPLTLAGEVYAPPLRAPVLDIPMTPDNLTFSAFGAGLATDPLIRLVTLTAANQMLAPMDAASLRIRVRPGTGVFTVSFMHDQTMKTVRGSGVFLQGNKTGAGVFRGASSAGAVQVE